MESVFHIVQVAAIATVMTLGIGAVIVSVVLMVTIAIDVTRGY